MIALCEKFENKLAMSVVTFKSTSYKFNDALCENLIHPPLRESLIKAVLSLLSVYTLMYIHVKIYRTNKVSQYI